MLKQQDMTETAAAVLHFLPADKWVTPRMMTRTTGVSEARCQLILTQLVLAGLAKDNGGYLKSGKVQLTNSGSDPLVGVVWADAGTSAEEVPVKLNV